MIHSTNQAADDCLLEGLRIGSPSEKSLCLDALIQRATERGLGGVIGDFDSLAEPLQGVVLDRIRSFHHALRECGRSEELPTRLAAIKLIALGRQGRLAYVLLENLHGGDDSVSGMAVKSLVALARWVSLETRSLQEARAGDAGEMDGEPATSSPHLKNVPTEASAVYQTLLDERPEVESAIAKALDLHRGKHAAELVRAALLVSDWPGSKTLGILQTAKHGGQSPLVRRLQQPPNSEGVEAFLLGATHGHLRSHFGITFSRIHEAPVLDAMLRKTHWLKDTQLQTCMHHVTRATWLNDTDLLHDIDRRTPADSARIGQWISETGVHDVVQDERIERLRNHAMTDTAARLRLLRIGLSRKRGASVRLIEAFLTDPDEQLMRLAAREIIRRRPADFENILLPLMTSAPASVRRVISRSIGRVGFELFWTRFDRLDRSTRLQAGRAMLKLLPDAVLRLGRRLSGNDAEQQIKAMQIVQELELSSRLRVQLLNLCTDPNAKVRSKAISVVGQIPDLPSDALIERLIVDTDARVRANTIEILESQQKRHYLPMLAQRARSTNNRERANAIKALHRMRVETAGPQLLTMLRDSRAEHRLSALWALRQTGIWNLVNEAVKLAKQDQNVKVRRYALAVVKNVVEGAQARQIATPVAKAG